MVYLKKTFDCILIITNIFERFLLFDLRLFSGFGSCLRFFRVTSFWFRWQILTWLLILDLVVRKRWTIDRFFLWGSSSFWLCLNFRIFIFTFRLWFLWLGFPIKQVVEYVLCLKKIWFSQLFLRFPTCFAFGISGQTHLLIFCCQLSLTRFFGKMR